MIYQAERHTVADYTLSYLGLRKFVGCLGIALPFVVMAGKFFFDGHGIQPSISDYYYTVMRDVFVGIVCAIGIFLLSYRGYDRRDEIAGDVAGGSAIGLAWLPTTPEVVTGAYDEVLGAFHYAFAAVFFLTLAYFCLVLFRKTSSTAAMTPRKQKRNIVYWLCGCAILGALAFLAIYKALGVTALSEYQPVFWLETVMTAAFGISWLIKGETLLKD